MSTLLTWKTAIAQA